MFPGRADPSASCGARPRPAPPSRCAPHRPDPLVVVRVSDSTNELQIESFVESKIRTYRKRVGSGQRTAGRRTGVPTDRFAQETPDPHITQSIEFVESKTRTYHGRVEPERRTAGQRGSGAVGRDADGSVRPEDKRPVCTRGIEDNCLERPFGRANKGNPM